MAWARPKYSKSKIDKAGEHLTNPRAWDQAMDMEDFLAVVNNHRSSHGFPLDRVKRRLKEQCRIVGAKAVTGQRIKRFSSIVNKLTRMPEMKLSRMQDIAGCRAIVENIGKVRSLHEACLEGLHHKLVGQKDYIQSPKPSGYRGVHLIYAYNRPAGSAFNGLKVEIQLRSQLQHAWATAVETIDRFTGQALKGGGGLDEWRRFFALTSSFIAAIEKSPPAPNTPLDESELRKEIGRYVAELNVFPRLRAYTTTLFTIEIETDKADYYLLELDAASPRAALTVRGYREADLNSALAEYSRIEQDFAMFRGHDSVLVAASDLKELKRAYPNYFADTEIFLRTLAKAA